MLTALSQIGPVSILGGFGTLFEYLEVSWNPLGLTARLCGSHCKHLGILLDASRQLASHHPKAGSLEILGRSSDENDFFEFFDFFELFYFLHFLNCYIIPFSQKKKKKKKKKKNEHCPLLCMKGSIISLPPGLSTPAVKE